MKTPVEISDALLAEARVVARREGTTVRALIEEGLRASLGRRTRSPRFTLRRATFKGSGPPPGFSPARWAEIREDPGHVLIEDTPDGG